MPKDSAYLEAEQKIADAGNHPRINPSTNSRMSASQIRLFVTPFVDGLSPKGG